jgi:hypothetical protein
MRYIIAILGTTFLSVACFAANYFVAPVQGSSADSSLNDSVRELVISAVSENGQGVVDKSDRADFVLQATLMQLGASQVVTMKKKKGTKVVFSTKMKAETTSELDLVVSRLTRAVLNEERPQNNPTVGEITDQEVNQISRRTESREYRFFSFGPFGLTNMNNTNVAYGFAAGYLWEVSPNAALRAEFDFSLATSAPEALYSALFLGANYYFSPTAQTLYVGGGFGYGMTTTNDSQLSRTGGFAISASLGYLFFRTSGTQMSVEARYGQTFAENNSGGNPGQMGLSLGIHY